VADAAEFNPCNLRLSSSAGFEVESLNATGQIFAPTAIAQQYEEHTDYMLRAGDRACCLPTGTLA